MPKMVATNKIPKGLKYAGKHISVGDTFNVSVHDVVLLRALGWVTDLAAVKAMTIENTASLVPTSTRHDAVTVHSHVVEESKANDEKIEQTAEVDKEGENEEEPKPLKFSSVLEAEPTESIEEHSDEPQPEDLLDAIDSANEKEEEVSLQTSNVTEYSKMLRDRARSLGLRVDGRWSDERVQREIDEYNKRTYQRMDIRASE